MASEADAETGPPPPSPEAMDVCRWRRENTGVSKASIATADVGVDADWLGGDSIADE